MKIKLTNGKEIELSMEDSKLYQVIMKSGNLKDMFEMGFILGRETVLKEVIELFSKK